MVNEKHFNRLKQGVSTWNAWREKNHGVRPSLFGANLTEANLTGADLSMANLSEASLIQAELVEADLSMANLFAARLYKANLSKANLIEAKLSMADLSMTILREADLSMAMIREAKLSMAILHRADLSGADLSGADLSGADLSRANLSGADLTGADLTGADLSGADLSGANLERADLSRARLYEARLIGANLWEAILHGANLYAANLARANLSAAKLEGADLTYVALIETDFTDANLTGCRIYGTSAWGLKLKKTKQQNLLITPYDEPEITVDNIEIAQFIYLMLHNEKIRDVIDTITSKAVLILGRFTKERKKVLNALREELRQRGYLPILFDFEKPGNQTRDETITLLARMARFVIADLSDAKSVLQELRAIVPDIPSVAVQPLILHSQEEPGMFDFFNPRLRPSMLETHRYDNLDQLIADLGKKVIGPAERKVLELRGGAKEVP